METDTRCCTRARAEGDGERASSPADGHRLGRRSPMSRKRSSSRRGGNRQHGSPGAGAGGSHAGGEGLGPGRPQGPLRGAPAPAPGRRGASGGVSERRLQGPSRASKRSLWHFGGEGECWKQGQPPGSGGSAQTGACRTATDTEEKAEAGRVGAGIRDPLGVGSLRAPGAG